MQPKRNNILLFLLLLTNLLLAQTPDQWLTAKIVADSSGVEKVNILNTRSYKNAMTDKDGIFKMQVRPGDALVISAVNLEVRRREITAEDLQKKLLIIPMSPKMNQLSEVTVNEHQLNSEDLGITSRGQRRYTPAERKVRTATTGLLDPLLNKMSGRTAMLKKGVQVERNERLLIKLDGYYEDRYYTDVLRIPDDYIAGFQYYIIEDADFARALQDNNKTLTMFYIKKLAVDYLDLIKKEQPESPR